MCLFPQPQIQDPKLPPETAAMKAPDANVAKAAGANAANSVRAAPKTILTSGSGVTTLAPTEKKTLLGQ